jgi:aldehyde dehydrogenase (NAD+)
LILLISGIQGYAELRKSFQDKKTLPLEFRRAQLLQLARLFQENSASLTAALHADLGRHKLEVAFTELGPIVSGAVRAAESLEEWHKPEKPTVEEWRSSWDTTIYTVPKGVVLIIGCVYTEICDLYSRIAQPVELPVRDHDASLDRGHRRGLPLHLQTL